MSPLRTEVTRAPGAPIGAPSPTTEADLDLLLSEPSALTAHALTQTEGDVLVLGAGGKMGPTVARMLRRTLDKVRPTARVIAVSRFSDHNTATTLAAAGVETIRCDLADRAAVAALPDAPNVIFMAGHKFGTHDDPAATWGANVLLPAFAAERYATARFVAFSTGNVYPFTSPASGGSTENDPLAPVGEYAASCVGRERVLAYSAQRTDTPMAIVRLNYAIDLRYGVLTDIATRVLRGRPVDVRMGYVNLIWQGDAAARAIACLAHVAVPPFVVNVTGPEILSVRAIAEHFGRTFGRAPVIEGSEAPDALLSNTARSTELFGAPSTSVAQMIAWVADWVLRGGQVLDTPTHFEEREGKF
ncbi:MAG TPA: NAD-dependent epimerase/dehydratase family protein [Gemmatimonadaceae bacterium]|nr:NAD-dependent epimerase/dehydratase family protein [Gemmatimonadaceae bacterium]